MSVSGGADEEAADDGSEGAAVVNCGPSLAGGCVGVSGLVLDIVAAAERPRGRMPSSSAGFRTMSQAPGWRRVEHFAKCNLKLPV